MEMLSHVPGFDKVQELTNNYIKEVNKIFPGGKIIVILENLPDASQVTTSPDMSMFEFMGLLTITEVRAKIIEGRNIQERLNAEEVLKLQQETLAAASTASKFSN